MNGDRFLLTRRHFVAAMAALAARETQGVILEAMERRLTTQGSL